MEVYAKLKIKLLKDFGVKLTQKQKAKFFNAKTENEVDRIARDFLQPYEF